MPNVSCNFDCKWERLNETRKLYRGRRRSLWRREGRRRHHHEQPVRRPRRFAARGAGRQPAAADQGSGGECQPRPQAFRDHVSAGHHQSGADRLRRHQLPLACERDRPRDPEAAVDVPAAHRHAARARGRDDPPENLDPIRFRGRARRRHRQGRPLHPEGARARARRRLHLLRRRQRARLPEILGDLGQEFSRHRTARPVDGDQPTRFPIPPNSP